MMLNLSAFDNEENFGEEDVVRFMRNRSAEDWSALLAQTEIVQFKQGDLVLQQGEIDRALYIVLTGELEVVLFSTEGEDRRLSRLAAGCIFGEQSFLDGKPRSATVRAVTNGEMRMLPWSAFERLSDSNPHLALGILFDIGCVLSERLRRMNQFIV
ncbi:Cyclic nucleotide-binding domain-containing protein [Alicyclobacillus tolerans]|uniref:Cyclic nucleotide-binding domain-containing protein n=2 Tax=Alicyclobacillus tolerans TaxID=90970 RepID=A0A1M6QQ45_9BACL|nr:Cyclic nucleotide-binding domain-containing protein [Alicyclobacillus montanus]